MEQCSICYDVFGRHEQCRFSCGHSFCMKCVKEWLLHCRRVVCPYCRQEFVPYQGMLTRGSKQKLDQVLSLFAMNKFRERYTSFIFCYNIFHPELPNADVTAEFLHHFHSLVDMIMDEPSFLLDTKLATFIYKQLKSMKSEQLRGVDKQFLEVFPMKMI